MAGEADRFLIRLRGGDTEYFRGILRAHHRALTTLAGVFVDPEAAEEVAHAVWLDWIEDLDQLATDREMAPAFLGHVVERARARAEQAGRAIDLTATALAEPDEPVLPDERFDPDQSWHTPMKSWDSVHGADVHNGKTLWDHLESAIPELSPPQRAMVILRDVEGLPADTVATMLGIGPELQAKLLHRGRARLRRAIELQIGE